jgi:hypothetical protein
LSVEAIAQTIQFILAPVVMITSCAILVSGFLTRYAELNDRMRALAKERLELLREPDGRLSIAATVSDAFKSERLSEIDAQLPGLLRRHELVHRSVLAVYVAILIFVVSMLAIAVARVPNSATLATVALAIFILGTVALLAGVALIAVEVRMSNAAVRYEVVRVMHLGK